jgi:8-oxo-dGTP diphosphatase
MPDEELLPHVAIRPPEARALEYRPGKAQAGPGVSTSTLHVVAAVIEHDDSFLVTRRQAGVHLAGLWEFPGGKVAPGESHEEALRREMLEELDTDVAVRAVVATAAHGYDDRHVTLHFYRCDLLGTPRPLLGQEMRWVRRVELPALGFPPADEELIALLVGGGL